MRKNPERLIFNEDRARYWDALAHGAKPGAFVRDTRGWILFGPYDVRGHKTCHLFCLQKLPGQKTPRVRVGCRYYTLRQAWMHWGVKKRGRYSTRRNECHQAIAIIRLMLLQAQAYALLSIYASPLKLDSTIIRSKRK